MTSREAKNGQHFVYGWKESAERVLHDKKKIVKSCEVSTVRFLRSAPCRFTFDICSGSFHIAKASLFQQLGKLMDMIRAKFKDFSCKQLLSNIKTFFSTYLCFSCQLTHCNYASASILKRWIILLGRISELYFFCNRYIRFLCLVLKPSVFPCWWHKNPLLLFRPKYDVKAIIYKFCCD